jgi:opacity protein-like surface antigen
MKRVLFGVLALVFVVGVAQAGEIDTKAGVKELVFGFSGLSNLSLNTYNGGVGVRYYISDGMAVRPGLEFGWSSAKTKSVLANHTEDKSSSANWGLNAVVEKHLAGTQSVSPYFGVGAKINATRGVEEPSVPTPTPNGTGTKQTITSWNVGGMLVAGFQWAFSGPLTLGGEYQLGLTYGKGKTETEVQGDPKATSNDHSSLSMGWGTASVYLSVPF